MKPLSETKALQKLHKLKTGYREFVRDRHEQNAKDCMTCEVQGKCCLDAHFVNVHITRLEAVAIQNAIVELETPTRERVLRRVDQVIVEYDLNDSRESFKKTFACPLFEKGVGCLVHEKGKPVPCIQHACYENESDIPPDELQLEKEKEIERLNSRVYGNAWNWLPLPVWIKKISHRGHRERREKQGCRGLRG